jgi:hypothetical protein
MVLSILALEDRVNPEAAVDEGVKERAEDLLWHPLIRSDVAPIRHGQRKPPVVVASALSHRNPSVFRRGLR